MKNDYSNESRGLSIVEVEGGYQLATKKEYYEFLFPIFDKRIKPKLSNQAMEVLAIIAYNPRITRSEIDDIRGVDSSGSMNKLLEFELIEPSGKSDLPGKPMTYKVTEEFLKTFGLKNLQELPELSKFKLDSNRQIVIDEIPVDEDKAEAEEYIDNELKKEK